jgi:hypothetical protein
VSDVDPVDHVRELIRAGRVAAGPPGEATTAAGNRVLGALADRHAGAADVRDLLRAVTFDAVAASNLAPQGRTVDDLTPQEASVLRPAIDGMPTDRQGFIGLMVLAATAISGIEHVTGAPFDEVLEQVLARAAGSSDRGERGDWRWLSRLSGRRRRGR